MHMAKETREGRWCIRYCPEVVNSDFWEFFWSYQRCEKHFCSR